MSRIAVIGSGISGMAAAYLLSRKHEVHLIERDSRIGGHTHTHAVETSRGVSPIDTGFIVHNDRTYPNLVKLFKELGVNRRKSDMSFGVSCQKTGFEYSSRGLGGLFAQKSNWLRPRHYRFLAEIMRFNREAPGVLDDPAGADLTLGEWIRDNHFSPEFSRYYLYPMAASVWSTSMEEIDCFPAVTLVRFFANHGFLGLNTHPQWYVLDGGSSQYIAPLTKPYRDRIRKGVEIKAVTRSHAGAHLSYATAPRNPSTKSSSPATARKRCSCSPTQLRWNVLSCKALAPAATTPCCTPMPGCCRFARAPAPRGTTTSVPPIAPSP